MSITPFTYADHQVRVLDIDGEPWFVAADVCTVLEVGNPTQALSRLDDDEVTLISNEGRPTNVVSEPGLYALVLGSRKQQAKPFKRWVTREVLPSIRKTGSYGTPRELSPDEIVQQALQITAQRVESLTARLALVEPKADAFDRWLSSNVDYSVGHVSNALAIAGAENMGRNRLFAFLSNIRWAYKADGQWTPYQTAIETGRLAVKLGSQLNTRTGEQFRTVTLRITPKGAAKLATLLGVMPETVADLLATNTQEDAA